MHSLLQFRAFSLVLLLAAGSARADTLTFNASSDIHGVVNYSWFSADNWYTNEPVTGKTFHVGHLPVPGDTAVLKSSVNAALNNIYISTLVVGGHAVNGGNFIVTASLQTSDGASFTDSTLNIQSQWLVTNACYLTRSTATVDAGAFVQFWKAPALSVPGLFLTDSTLFNVGQIILTDGTILSFSGGTNRLNNRPNAVLSGTGASRVSTVNQAGAWLIFDNDGLVRCDSGTLRFDGWNVVWTNSHALGKFKTTATNATLELDGPLTVPAGATYSFSGPGLSRLNGTGPATVQGVLSVGLGDPASKLVDAGTLESRRDVSGTGVVHVVASNGVPSTLNLSSGKITVAAVNIDPDGQLKITGASGLSLVGTTINNSGTATWMGEGNAFSMYNSATFNNLAGALFDAQNDAAILGGGGTNDGTFNNAGTFRKSAGTNDTFFWYSYSPGVTFNNTSLLDVESGRVVLMGGTNSGQFNVAAGARLRFWRSPYVLADGATFTGAGSVALGGNSAVLLVNANVSVENFTSDSSDSILDGPATLTLTGSSTWSGGTMQGSGAVNVASNASLSVTAGVSLNQRTINNAGTVTLTGGVSAGKGAVFNNLAGGVLNLRVSNMGFDYNGSGALPVFNNAGTVLGPVGFEPNMNWGFTNRGSVLVQGPNMNFGRGLTQLAGSTVVAAGATLTPGWTSPLLLQGGTLSGYGTIAGPVVNGATINFGGTPGILEVNGGVPKFYTQTSNGVLAIKIGGPTAGTQFDQLAVNNNGPTALDGTLAVSFINGFVPALGDSFPVVTFGSSAGAFAAVTGNRTGNGLVLVPRNTGNSITLVAANDLQLSAPAGNPAGFSFLSTAGFAYAVEYADSLQAPIQWRTLTNLNGNGSILSVVVPAPPGAQRFYRARFE